MMSRLNGGAGFPSAPRTPGRFRGALGERALPQYP